MAEGAQEPTKPMTLTESRKPEADLVSGLLPLLAAEPLVQTEQPPQPEQPELPGLVPTGATAVAVVGVEVQQPE